MNNIIKSAYDAEAIPESATAELMKIMHSGDLFRYTSEISPVTILEKEFAKLMGAKYALAVSSCSAALYLSLEALNLKLNARIIIPAFTFAAVPSSIVNARMTPVLVEVNDNYRIDLDDFESKIDSNIDAVMISHMRGHTSDMDYIMKLCDERNIPVIEDAAHSLGTLWNNKKIGTIGKVGCFSFQSYKMINAGEGGMLITDDPRIIARAIIMSGAYEKNWQKHNVDIALEQELSYWQNKLPLYNLRMHNLSAIVVQSQLPLLEKRVKDGLANHNYVAEKLNKLSWIEVPNPLDPELRAPDSIQFNLIGIDSDKKIAKIQNEALKLGINLQVFGLSKNNARAFWNWEFIPEELPKLPKTKKMLMRACDVRLPAWLTKVELDNISNIITKVVTETMESTDDNY